MSEKDAKRLAELIDAGYPCITMVTYEEAEAVETVREATMELVRPFYVWSVGYGLRSGRDEHAEAEPETDTAAPALAHIMAAKENAVYAMLDLGDCLGNEVARRMLRDAVHEARERGAAVVLIDHTDNYPEVIKAYAARFELSLPDEKELGKLVRATLREIHKKRPIEVGITRKGLQAIVRNLRGLTRRQARGIIRETVASDRRFDDDDVNLVLASKRKTLRADGLLEYIESPLTLDQIGGMNRLKTWLRRRRGAFRDDAAEYGLEPPKGVLMLGVQGAGKSLCAKATATAWQQPLLRMDPSALYNKFIGQSEENLRRALTQAEMMAPVILWIDEIEKGFASAASQSNDGGLSQRMFGTLLTWMQDHEAPVFLIATANDIEALPPELLRKGRFDEIFFVGLPKKAARKKIFEIHIAKRHRDPAQFDLDRLADASEGYSGAEIEQAVLSALHESFSTKAELTTDLMVKALENSPPLSVTMREKIEALYAWAEDRCVPAN
jgi:SpoVK/Ycf46/Vps4 family AAA+-type ATPase